MKLFIALETLDRDGSTIKELPPTIFRVFFAYNDTNVEVNTLSDTPKHYTILNLAVVYNMELTFVRMTHCSVDLPVITVFIAISVEYISSYLLQLYMPQQFCFLPSILCVIQEPTYNFIALILKLCVQLIVADVYNFLYCYLLILSLLSRWGWFLNVKLNKV